MVKFVPELKENLGFLNTPVIAYTKGDKVTRWSYNLQDEKELQKGEVSNYKKGLGSWDPEDLEAVIKQDGLDKMIQKVEFTDQSVNSLDEWFGSDSEPRKKHILANNFSIASA
jgi:phage pi2 protein 07